MLVNVHVNGTEFESTEIVFVSQERKKLRNTQKERKIEEEQRGEPF